MSILSDEVNFLVYRYLQESGYQHSAFSFGLESHIAQSNVNGSVVPPGALINIIQKGVQYIEAELCINDDGSFVDDLDCIEPIPLIDAVIPEALAVRAATILKNAGQNQDSDKNNPVANDVEMGNESSPVETSNLSGHTAEVFCCRWSPSSKQLASSGADCTVRLWPTSQGSNDEKKSIVLDHCNDGEKSVGSDITAMTFNYDGTLLASAADDFKIKVWNYEGQCLTTLSQHKGLVFALKWNKKGSCLLSCSLDRRSIVWDANTWEVKQIYEHHRGPVVDVDWQNNTSFASCSTDKMIYLCKLGTDKPVRQYQGHTDEVNCVTWDQSGTSLASCSDDCTIKIWGNKQDATLHTLTGHIKEVTLVEWSSLNNIIASASYDATVRLWNVELETCVFAFNRHILPVQTISFTSDGKYLASGSLDGYAYVWCTQTGKSVIVHKSGAGIFDVRWKQDSSVLALCQADKMVKLIHTKKLLACQ